MKIDIFSIYNPPTSRLNTELFNEITLHCKRLIICGDLNAKNKSFGCFHNNANGEDLLNICINEDLSIFKTNNDPTFHRTFDNFSDILDLFVGSNNLLNNLANYQVITDSTLTSDHYQFRLDLTFSNQTSYTTTKIEKQKILNFNKANWKLFEETLNEAS